MAETFARIAVADVAFWVDRPYDYLLPAPLAERAAPGMRVLVPFSRNNRRTEGIILRVASQSDFPSPKSVDRLLDEAPVLTVEQLALALWMRERFFCTVYEAVKAMLPAGLWFRPDGKRRVSDRRSEWVRLLVPPEDALDYAEHTSSRARRQASVLRLLAAVGEAELSDLRAMSGASRQSVLALCSCGIAELFFREELRRPAYRKGVLSEKLPELSEEQGRVYAALHGELGRGTGCSLLQGVTGSGKTAVYIHLISDALAAGGAVLLLVPEIALTPQMLETFSSYFGENIAVLHSSLSASERYDEWKRVKTGQARLVIGTRSAVFAPTGRLGLVIIDEEQESSYKSDSSPRYHARDVAKYRCAKDGALLLLGSATPDICSKYLAETGKYRFFALRSRYNRLALPAVRVVDMKLELRAGNGGSISSVLREEMERNIAAGEQSILFLNRRGVARLVCCPDCGFTFQCPNCSVNLTYHGAGRRLLCHACGYTLRLPPACPDCGGSFCFSGDGTEKVQGELEALFPGVAILRADTDSVAEAGSHEALWRRFREENIPVMIGTQMVTKGLNFDRVTLVGVLQADLNLYAGSYRASERTFSLLTQVIGRGGRAEKPGRAVIQTFTPDNQVIRFATRQDYDGFFRSEIELRRIQKSPPFSQLIVLTVVGSDETRVLDCCSKLRDLLLHGFSGSRAADVLGPAPYPVVKVLHRFRYKLTVRSPADPEIRTVVSKALIHCNSSRDFRGVSVFADLDPLD